VNNKINDLIKRRGFIWQSFEIYGGVSGFVDFGPIGLKILKRLKINGESSLLIDMISFMK
jgi:Glycyl-tRNA synthetase (class II)